MSLELLLEPSNFEHRAMLTKRTIAVDRGKDRCWKLWRPERTGIIAASPPRPFPGSDINDQLLDYQGKQIY